jgi:hypothetical protein
MGQNIQLEALLHHGKEYSIFYVLLTVQFGIIFVNNQLDAQLCFRVCLFQFCTCFERGARGGAVG